MVGPTFIGIDPGLHGALAWMDGERRQIEVRDCPLTAGEYDFFGMWKAFETACASGPAIVVMEKVHSMPSDGKASAFSFGVGYGAWLAICGMFRIPPNLVAPQTWKRVMLAGIANDKRAEAMALKQRFQGHPICAQLHGPRGGLRDGRVDALFLAEYARVAWKISGKRAA
jgi:hypothetical protein